MGLAVEALVVESLGLASVAAWGAGDAAGAGAVSAGWAIHGFVSAVLLVVQCLKALRYGEIYAFMELSMCVLRVRGQVVNAFKKGLRDCLLEFINFGIDTQKDNSPIPAILDPYDSSEHMCEL